MKFFRNERGLSFVEVLLGAAGIGVVALGLMNLTNQQAKNQANVEAKFSSQELKQIITNLFYDKVACTNTLGGSAIGAEVNALKNPANESIFVKGQKYGSNNLIISSLRTIDKNRPLTATTRQVDLLVTFQKAKAITNRSGLAIAIPLKVTASSAAGPIVDCLSYDDQFVQRAGDVMTGALTTTQLNVTNDVTASGAIQGQAICTSAGANCKNMNDFVLSNQGCPPNQYLDGVQGTPRCRTITYSCPTGQAIRAIAANGAVTCVDLIPPGCPAMAFTQSGQTCTVPGRDHGQTGSCSQSTPGECKWGKYDERGNGWGYKCKSNGFLALGDGSGAYYRCMEKCQGPTVTITKLCFKGAWQ
ncbi:type IV pilus modification PilV family protein [Peredibacter starrii]|uniref:Prepilin-type N-terminal cleavage/methylation domain-containing protein n=1 Tax=Peredibacter starrii TaxID=28202 RepID=A0AAX4HL48_9BACT|nr:hypothetical protein [Peredibacter starrii]WPU63714.1 hypothetical protein SOO65_13550 [Peredibacter starrii]